MKSIYFIAGLVACSTAFQVNNYIKNGNFAENYIGKGEWIITKQLPGWEIPGQVQQGKGTLYNWNWGDKFVVELDGYQNNIIRQKLDLQKGSYTLELEYAARSGCLATSEMSISWNGHKVKRIKGEDYLVHTIKLPLQAVNGTNILQIAGEGISDSQGMTITNVRLTMVKEREIKEK